MARGSSIQVEGLDALRKRFRELPQRVAAEVDADVRESADLFVEGAINDAPRDEGIIIQGISTKKKAAMDHEVVSAAPYSAYVEFGTKRRVVIPSDLASYAAQFKGKGNGGGEGFFEHIFDWVKRKKIRYESAGMYKSGKKKGQYKLLTYEQTAWIIYHFILLNGVKPHPFFFKQRGPVMQALKLKIQPTIKKVIG